MTEVIAKAFFICALLFKAWYSLLNTGKIRDVPRAAFEIRSRLISTYCPRNKVGPDQLYQILVEPTFAGFQRFADQDRVLIALRPKFAQAVSKACAKSR